LAASALAISPRAFGKTNQYSLIHARKTIGFKPMTPKQILKDDLARASKLKKQGVT
jgi:hypothetical protein